MAKKQKKRTGKKLPWIKILLWIFLLAGISGFFNAEAEVKEALLVTAFSIIGLLICYRTKILSVIRKIKKSKAKKDIERIQPEAQARVAAEMANQKKLTYKLRGVTFQNRQKNLEKLDMDVERYLFPAIELEPYEWEGKPACRVYVCPTDGGKELDVGNIPAENVEEVLALADRMTDAYVKVYGGPAYDGDDKSYGAELTIIYK